MIMSICFKIETMKKFQLFLFLFVAVSFSTAQDNQIVNIRSYLGTSFNTVIITGSFNGEDYFPLENEIVLVPKLDLGYGFGINGGFRFQRASLDFAFKRSSHHCSFMDGTLGIASFNVIKFIGIKTYIGNSPIIKPLLDFDLSGTWMRVTDASYQEISPEVVDRATFGAIILGIGGGLAIEPGKHIGIEIEVLPAYYMGTDVKGILKSNYETSQFNSFKLDASIGLIYYFRAR